MRNHMRTAIRLSLGIAIVGAAACSAGSDVSTGPGGGTEPPNAPVPSITGTFRLASVNGGPLPALVWDDHTADGFGAQMYVVSGSIVLRSDSTYRQISNNRLVIEGVTDQTWNSINDGTYSFTPYDGGPGYEPSTPEGTITFKGESGGQITLPLTGWTITHQAMIPGAVGGPDVPVTLVYLRQ